MPGLTVTEKSHWRDRIAARITRATERIKARHPALFDRIAREAHTQALGSLGLADAYAELEAIKLEDVALARRKKQAQRVMIATLWRTPIDEVTDSFSIRYGSELALPHEVAEAMTRRQTAHQEQLLAADPIGREIVRLDAEKDNLLDTVWLAISPTQIKQLWAKVGELADLPGTRSPGHQADRGGLIDAATPSQPSATPTRPPPTRSSPGQPQSHAARRLHTPRR